MTGPRHKRARSDFPKDSFEEALRVPRALEKNAGQPLPPIDTAAGMDLSPGSFNFRRLLSSSIKYGLTTGTEKADRVALEPLGRSVMQPTAEAERHEAVGEAILRPPTFQAIYGYYRGKKLPERQFFENTVVREFNVPPEHAAQCVDIFTANMEYGGLLRDTKGGKWLATEPLDTRGPREPESDAEWPGQLEGHDDETPGAEKPIDDTSGQGRETDTLPRRRPSAIFLGHGKNRRPLEQLVKTLDQYGIPHREVVDQAHRGRPISEKVKETMEQCGAAILIFTPDEELFDQAGASVWRPSENVVHELGAASVLYDNRIIIFKERSVSLASNFSGIGYIEFDRDALDAKLNELFKELIAFKLVKVTVGDEAA